MKICSIVGARPQFIKAAALSRVLRKVLREVLIHTGQHYDERMSGLFFRELDISEPDYNLEIGSGPHGRQTGLMMEALEKVLLAEKPDLVLVYGDTNSTVAGALAAAKLPIPVGHVEAGLRSFNRVMPEEINRVLTDRLSSLLFCPTETAVINLRAEGMSEGVHLVGDVMCDALLHYRSRAGSPASVFRERGLRPREYCLLTVHRAENTDNPVRLKGILTAVGSLGLPVIFPVHPRTAKIIAAAGIELGRAIKTTEPLSYLEMLALEGGTRAIFTDSGGVQKEAYLLGIPCFTLREETEWVETLDTGWNVLAGTSPERILAAWSGFSLPEGEPPRLFGEGKSCEKIVKIIMEHEE